MGTRSRAATGLGMLSLTLSLGACSADTKRADSTKGAGDSAKMGGMPMDNMGGMKGMDSVSMSGSMRMMGEMKTHMEGMMKMTGEQMKGMVPAHRQMAANMVAEMSAEMKAMNMTGDAAWTAVIDSVRRDLTALPEMGASKLPTFMAAHHGRVTRLMQMHERMSRNMKM